MKRSGWTMIFISLGVLRFCKRFNIYSFSTVSLPYVYGNTATQPRNHKVIGRVALPGRFEPNGINTLGLEFPVRLVLSRNTALPGSGKLDSH